MDKEQLSEYLLKVTDRLLKLGDTQVVDETCPIGIIDIEHWEWPQGVATYGLYKYYRETGDKKYFDFLIEWYERQFIKGLPDKNVNTMAPMLALAFLAEETGNERYLGLCRDWAKWVKEEMPRAGDGALQHIVTGGENPGQVWDDTLYMTGLFLAKAGMLFGIREYVDESIRQVLVHIKYLFDTKSGLWFHGWDFNGRHNFARALWARGNSWITAGLPDFLEITGVDGGVRQFIVDTLKNQIDALVQYQDTSGLWHTLIDDPGSYLESSASAGFGYGILKCVRMGILDESYKKSAIKALQGVIGCILPDGTVDRTSYGTGMGRDFDHYRNIPVCPMTYGQSLTLLLLSEAMKLRAYEL